MSCYGQVSRCGVTYHSEEEVESPVYAYPREDVVIPVVFHVVWHNTSENISDKRIRKQLAVLNEDYNQNNADIVMVARRFQRDVGNSGIEFCLANRTPDGDPHKGIIRVKTEVEQIGGKFGSEGLRRRIKHDDLGGSSAWDTERYLNVWISARDDEILGVATFPNENIPDGEDGVEIDYRAITGNPDLSYPYRLGRTLTHEIGHYLNLQHLWGSELSCTNAGDGVDDTPKQGKAYFGCPHGDHQSCGSHDMVSNFMNFSYDECMHFFTKGQVERMRDALFKYRYELISGEICNAGKPVPPDPLDLSVIRQSRLGLLINLSRVPQINYKINVYDMTGRLYWTANQTPLSIHLVDSQNWATGIYIVQLSAPNINVVRKILVTR